MATKPGKLVNRIAPSSNGEHAKDTPKPEVVKITPPNFRTVKILVKGTSRLVLCRFNEKARQAIQEKQEAGRQAQKGRKRESKDFEKLFHLSRHISPEGWDGIHCTSFLGAMVDAAGNADMFKTKARTSLAVIPDGYGKDGAPLVRITKFRKDEPKMQIDYARGSGTADLRSRPAWEPGWEATVSIRFDADMFGVNDIANLLSRAGCSFGIGEGRANSKKSNGCGWGFFEVLEV